MHLFTGLSTDALVLRGPVHDPFTEAFPEVRISSPQEPDEVVNLVHPGLAGDIGNIEVVLDEIMRGCCHLIAVDDLTCLISYGGTCSCTGTDHE
jgi:hypothetical protein